MKVAVFSTKKYVRDYFNKYNSEYGHKLTYFEVRLNEETAPLAVGFPAVCVFVNDSLNEKVLEIIHKGGTRLIALRCAGFNNVHQATAERLGMTTVRVPSYSPNAVAEHAVALMLGLNRKLIKAHRRVHEGNFDLAGLLGFDMNGKTAGIVGTGNIGAVTAKILTGFNMKILCYDVRPNPEVEKIGGTYVELDELYTKSDVISLHCPLMPATTHMIDEASIAKMKDGVMVINTSRGGLVDTEAVIEGLKSGKIGYLGLDVYEEEEALFFEDQSEAIIQDDQFARLLSFQNVIITGHQAFFTSIALEQITKTTLGNIRDFEDDGHVRNTVILFKK